MKKSSFVFLIMAIVYILLFVGYSLRMVTITNNIVFGLSLTALLISISDLLSKVIVFRSIENEYQQMIEYTLSFIEKKIKLKQTNNPIIIIRNLRSSIEMGKKKKYKPVHPLEYADNSLNKALNIASIILFMLGISVFIFTPFINEYDIMDHITTRITVAAFASMCLGVFFDDQIMHKQEERDNLISK